MRASSGTLSPRAGRLVRDALPAGGPPLTLLDGDAYEAMAAADLALSSCGTANLEVALLGTPLVAFYRLSRLTYLLGHPFVRIRDYSIVNILAGRRIVPELVQGEFTADGLVREAVRLLESPEARAEMKGRFREIRDGLGTEPASKNVAAELAALAGDAGA